VPVARTLPRPRIALTGATGFLGRHIVAELVADHDLVCITRSGSAPEGHQGLSIDLAAEADPTPALTQALVGCDAVIHAAGRVSHDPADAGELWRVHVVATERLIDAARAAGVPRVVALSSSGTTAVSTRPVAMDEDAPSVLQTIARWPYYRSKWVAEDAALAGNGPDLAVICLLPGLLLGPGDDAEGASTRAVRLFLDRGLPAVPAGGPCIVDVRDVALAVRAALRRGRGGERYLLGGGNLAWSQLYGALARITGRAEPLLTLPGRLTRRAVEVMGGALRAEDGGEGLLPLSPEELELASHFWYCSWDKAARELGFSPRDPIRTLEDTVADILDQRQRGYQLYRSRA